jgi:malonate decarboxylase beta subunit
VRLQEANYGLLVIAEIQSAIVALRRYVPVVGLIPGSIGCFGGMSITAALCSRLLMTRTARFGLNGPEVIEQEAGVQEFDSRDRRLIWDTIGGSARHATGLVDELLADDSAQVVAAVRTALALPPTTPRTQQVGKYLGLLNQLDPTAKPTAAAVVQLLEASAGNPAPAIADAHTPSRGRSWFAALTANAPSSSDFPGVLVADAELAGQLTRFVAVVPNAANRYPRARHGEVGLQEGWTLAKYVRQALEADRDQPTKRPIVAIIDVPSQAYGYVEELAGIHYACAAAADAYATARQAGHPVVGLVVGNAISGAFLAHGLQASQLIALDDKEITVQAMSRQSAARITRRTLDELEAATRQVPAMAYDMHSYYTLGALEPLLTGINADEPTAAEVATVADRLTQAIEASDGTLARRLHTEPARHGGRNGSLLVRAKLAEQWT